MWKKLRLVWSLTAICLGGALVVSWAHPAGAVPYSKKPIYDDTNLFRPPGPWAHIFISARTAISFTRPRSIPPANWVYSLYLYHHGDGSVTQIPSGTWEKSDLQINDQGQVVWGEHDMIAYTTVSTSIRTASPPRFPARLTTAINPGSITGARWRTEAYRSSDTSNLLLRRQCLHPGRRQYRL